MIPLPVGFEVAFDRSVRCESEGRLLVGGRPGRALHLTNSGRDALLEIQSGRVESESARLLARLLIEAGMAHPRPPKRECAPEVTIIVPVRDRSQMLDKCLGALGDQAPLVVVDDGSRDPALTTSICARHGATLFRLEPGRGAAAARNAGVAATSTEFVGFVDSDCIPHARWLHDLLPHFADPAIAAVAPRIVPRLPAGPATSRKVFTTMRSPLDMGPHEGLVTPRGAIPYVPTAALIVRRAALEPPFDPSLRYGEDVDLVWRLHDAGWEVRYVPQVLAEHDEPTNWRGLLTRRFRYGTSVGPLARRHSGRLSHLVLQPWTTATTAALFAGYGKTTLAMTAVQTIALSRRSGGVRLPLKSSSRYAVSGVGHTIEGVGRASTMFAAPVLIAALAHRRTRRTALALLAAPPVAEWVRRRPGIDPLRWSLACLADDVAYGAGVWRGCVAERTVAPLVPEFVTNEHHTAQTRPNEKEHDGLTQSGPAP